jgi:hypothetical protein
MRVSWVQRDIRSAGLQDGELANDHVGRTIPQLRDTLCATGRVRDQTARPPKTLHASLGSDQLESWNRGHQYLMLSIVYSGIGYPVVWSVLPKAGNSDITERETAIEIFIDIFGAFNIACLLGDREFISKAWFHFLKEHQIKFQMRLHKDTLV